MKYRHFDIEEREIIQTMWWERKSVREIARALNRSPSSISREMRKNFPSEHKVYSPRLANQRALLKRKSRGRKNRLKSETIRLYVINHLKLRWSPEQISGRLKKDLNLSISHEAIYQYIYSQIHRDGYGLLKLRCEDLRMYLRRRRKRRQGHHMRKGQRIFKFKANSINLRPKEVELRQRIGDWEGDSVESCNHKPGVNTLVERKTGYVFITKLHSRNSFETTRVVTKRMGILPKEAKQTLTLDNGSENSDWESIQKENNISVFSANPYHSWERGTNENTNGLIRDYFPKKTDFTKVRDEDIQKVEYDLNTRPRKRLNWSTPLEAMSVALQS